ncbi:unnamed protein product [Schistosoma curassoni]|uniref:DUF6451 domain-containing protein n=1 Tax=Schistosoma curassoni TaxID=6186 RepID=A0A183JLD2_9TREM|nr:unnamed protein product [Schistosoma curassoni]
MRQLYDTTKKLAGNYCKLERPVKSKESKVMTNIEEQRNRSLEHFKELLNPTAPLNPPDIEAATLRIIVEQSIEWNSSLYINFIDCEKAFDSVDRTALWRLLRHYGTNEKIVNIIPNSYDGINCKTVHGGQLKDSFEIMKTSTSGGKHEIQWTARMQLDDLDFADDLVLLSHMQQQMQEKTTSVAAASAAVGLEIHKGESKILRYNTACNNRITFGGEDLGDVKTFTYLGSIIDEHSGSDAYVNARIRKARAAYLQLRNISNSKQLSTNTKVGIFNTNVKTVLLYGAETWKTTRAIIRMIQVFINSCLRKILRIRWPDTVCNNLLWEKKLYPSGGRNQEEALKMDRTHIDKSSQLCHKTSPHLKSSRPKEKRKTEEMKTDMRRMTTNWIKLERKVQDRVGWRMLVGGLCSIGGNRCKKISRCISYLNHHMSVTYFCVTMNID